MSEAQGCWCGATAHEPVREDYAQCHECGSLFYSRPYAIESYTSIEEESGYYGPSYWRDHVPNVLGLPRLEERAKSDLTDRVVYYLKRSLEHLSPGTSILELGCAPGCFGYLLTQAGMQVTGVEASTLAVEFVRRTFHLNVHRGPLERLKLKDRFGAVVAIDVLEHLPRPLETLEACVARMPDAGLLVLQTPCYRGEGATWQMMVPAEHLYLYTEESIRELLLRAGFRTIEVSRSRFPCDMWVVASRQESLPRRPDPLAGLEPVALALIQMYDERRVRDEEGAAINRDREAKETLNIELSRELEAVRVDQQAKEALIVRLSQELKEVRADQQAKEALIHRLTRDLEDGRAGTVKG